jgi:hypothetical protein
LENCEVGDENLLYLHPVVDFHAWGGVPPAQKTKNRKEVWRKERKALLFEKLLLEMSWRKGKKGFEYHWKTAMYEVKAGADYRKKPAHDVDATLPSFRVRGEGEKRLGKDKERNCLNA